MLCTLFIRLQSLVPGVSFVLVMDSEDEKWTFAQRQNISAEGN